MSGIKEPNVAEFYRSLNRRGLTITDIAESINCGRSHLSQVFNGRRTGQPTWRKVEASGMLTDYELELLGRIPAPVRCEPDFAQQESATSTCHEAAGTSVPRATFSHVEHEPQQVSA